MLNDDLNRSGLNRNAPNRADRRDGRLRCLLQLPSPPFYSCGLRGVGRTRQTTALGVRRVVEHSTVDTGGPEYNSGSCCASRAFHDAITKLAAIRSSHYCGGECLVTR
jgi:hypothetical protein